jgi:MYXO-CTERM domain-containing protein
MQWADPHVFIVNNTIVNSYDRGTFINATAPIDLHVINNLFIGPGTLVNGGTVAQMTTNLMATPSVLAGAASYDYHLVAGSAPIDAGTDPGADGTFSLVPTSEYAHPRSTVGRTLVGTIDVGAYEFGSVPAGDAGAMVDAAVPGTDAGPGVDGGAGGTDAGSSTDGAIVGRDAGGTAPPASGGCGCRAHGDGPARGMLLAIGALVLAVARRRR